MAPRLKKKKKKEKKRKFSLGIEHIILVQLLQLTNLHLRVAFVSKISVKAGICGKMIRNHR